MYISFRESALALCSGTGWENPFQFDFSLAHHVSMSSRTRSQKVNKTGGEER